MLLFPFVGGEHVPRRMARKRNDSFRKTKFTMADRGALSAGPSQAGASSRLSAVPGRASARGCAQPGARPSSGGGAGLPGLAPAAAGAAFSSQPAGPAYLSARMGGGHGSAGMGAAWTGRSSAFPLITGSSFWHDAGGTNGLHYPRGPAIVRRHQAATAVLRAGGLPSVAPPSSRSLPASGAPPPRRALGSLRCCARPPRSVCT